MNLPKKLREGCININDDFYKTDSERIELKNREQKSLTIR